MKQLRAYLTYIFLTFYCLNNVKAQEIDGTWSGTFVKYVHDMYDIKMEVKKLPPGNLFTAKLSITDGSYFGEFNISGYICNKRYLEISTIVIINENAPSKWVDCLNGTFDLSDDEVRMTFTASWVQQYLKNSACKMKYLQKDMFQCLRSVYFRKVKNKSDLALFDESWANAKVSKNINRKPVPTKAPEPAPIAVKTPEPKPAPIAIKTPDPVPVAVKPSVSVTPKEKEKPTVVAVAKSVEENEVSETKMAANNEESSPILETIQTMKSRKIIVKNEIIVKSKNITVEYWDRYTEDGDSVNIYLNGIPIVKNALLTKAKKSMNISLNKPQNYIILEAINLGTEPPNTASMNIKYDNKVQFVSLTSTLQTSAAIKITLEE